MTRETLGVQTKETSLLNGNEFGALFKIYSFQKEGTKFGWHILSDCKNRSLLSHLSLL